MILSRDLARYTDQKRSLGFKFRSQHVQLRAFVAYAERRGGRTVKSARVLAWAAEAPSPEPRGNRLLTVRRFALVMHAENARHQIPAADALGHAIVKRRPPYIYSPDEIVRLLRVAAALEPTGSIRPVMYAMLLGLIAATGMRIAEALALQLDDVIPDSFVIRETKFQKSPPPATACDDAAGPRRISGRSTGGGRCGSCSLHIGYRPTTSLQQRALRDRTELRGAHSGRDTRIHDLRHTFAVRLLEQCRHDRNAVARHIVALSTYLGDAHVTDTYWYLQATPFLMGQIAEAGEAFLMGGAA